MHCETTIKISSIFINKWSSNRELRFRKQRYLIEKFCTLLIFILNIIRQIKKFNQNKMAAATRRIRR